jgi:hypothetical protein
MDGVGHDDIDNDNSFGRFDYRTAVVNGARLEKHETKEGRSYVVVRVLLTHILHPPPAQQQQQHRNTNRSSHSILLAH